MLKPIRHKSTEFAGMYAGVNDYTALNMINDEAEKEFFGFDESGYAAKKPVLGYNGFISSIPEDETGYVIPLIGPDYAVTDTDVNGHAVTSNIPIAVLVKKLTAELNELGIEETITEVKYITPAT